MVKDREVLQSRGSQRVGHNLATEQQQQSLFPARAKRQWWYPNCIHTPVRSQENSSLLSASRIRLLRGSGAQDQGTPSSNGSCGKNPCLL